MGFAEELNRVVVVFAEEVDYFALLWAEELDELDELAVVFDEELWALKTTCDVEALEIVPADAVELVTVLLHEPKSV